MQYKTKDYNSIKEYIDKYNQLEIKQLKYPNDESKLLFKEMTIKNMDKSIATEDLVIQYYKNQGYNAFFAENRYWLLLFLIFYFKHQIKGIRLLAELEYSTNTYSDSYIPRLHKMDFTYIKTIPNLNEYIIRSYYECLNFSEVRDDIFKKGDLNQKLFSIHELLASVCHLDIEQLILIFKRMGADFEYYTSGFPDLIVYNHDEFFLVEVKSKEDKPSFKQIQWHKYLVDIVNIDVVIFNINKTNAQVKEIKKSYDVELLEPKKRKILQQSKIFWNEFRLDEIQINDEEITKRLKRRFFDYVSEPTSSYYTPLKESFQDPKLWSEYLFEVQKRTAILLYESAVKVYSNITDWNIHKPTKKQFLRNKEAKLLENEGDYKGAISLYIKNVHERTTSPTTYKRLIVIYKKFEQFQELEKLMNIAIIIFSKLKDKNNVLYFLFMKFQASKNSGRLTLRDERILKGIRKDDIKLKESKEKYKQTDLSSYFN